MLSLFLSLWHDGEPLTAGDVKFTLNCVMTLGTNGGIRSHEGNPGRPGFPGWQPTTCGEKADGHKIQKVAYTPSTVKAWSNNNGSSFQSISLENASPETARDQFLVSYSSGPFKRMRWSSNNQGPGWIL